MKITQREMMLGVVTLACVLAGTTWYAVAKYPFVEIKKPVPVHLTFDGASASDVRG